MGDFPLLPEPSKAQFRPLGPKATPADTLVVHFNPESLQYTVSNTLRDEGRGAQKKQFVDKTDPKLSMQLVFDTTDSGLDVRLDTIRLARLISPYDEAEKAAKKNAKGGKQVPPNVEFSWGNFAFTGLLESYKETLDYFSANGVPLRATIDLTMTGQQPALGDETNPPAKADVDAAGAGEAAILPATGGPAGLANALGAPRAARDLARANGAESLRGGSQAGVPLAVPRAPAEPTRDVSARATLANGNADARASVTDTAARAEATVGAEGGPRARAEAGLGVLPGGRLGGEAALSTGGGGFGGLRTRIEASTKLPDPAALLKPGGGSFGLSIGIGGSGGGIGIGGAGGTGGGDFGGRAEVGSAADLARLIRFE